MQTHAHACARSLPYARPHTRTHTHTHTQVRGGGLTELDTSKKEGLAGAVAAAGLLGRSAATLTRLNVG
jgi:hypothetical protein